MGNIQDWLAPVLTLLGTIFAGVGLKLMDGLLTKAKAKDDTATAIRDELRQEIIQLKAEIKATEAGMVEWRAKYYAVMEEVIPIKAELEAARRMLNQNAPVITPSNTPPLTQPPA